MKKDRFQRASRVARQLLLVVGAAATFATLALAADEIDRRGSKGTLRGTITAETATEVTIKGMQTGEMGEVRVPVAELIDVRYDGPAGLALRTAAGLERAGEFTKAIGQYQKAAAGASGFVGAAIEFGQARSAARQALNSPAKLDDALRGLEQFKSKNPNTRHHFALYELIGRLQLEKGDATAARAAFAELAKAPWPEYQNRAAIWEGRILMKSESFAEAVTKFDAIAAASAKTPEEKLRQQEALLAKGECLAQLKKVDEAVELFRKIIDTAAPEETNLQATAQLALGDVLREAGRPKDALMAYLAIDGLYSAHDEAHPRALGHIAQLWDQLGRPELAAAAREKLQRLHPETTSKK
jgi:tetratricopeptide (TPR) repeat protein